MPPTQLPDSQDEGQPTSSAITDRRPPVRGALPRRAQMWVMLGLAGALLGIIILTGNPTPSDRPAPARTSPTAVDTQRVTGYQQQLAQRERELARQMAALEQQARAPIEPTASARDQQQQASAPPSDPLAEERRRREYQSLFSSNVALTTRTDRTSTSRTDNSSTTASATPDERELQALETQGRESLARLNASVNALEQATRVQPAQPVSPPSSAPSPTPKVEPDRPPANTPAIRPGASLHRVLEGTMLESVLMTRLDGDFPAPVMCLVTTPLYSHHGDALLVPSGSRVLGRAKAVDTWGQRRLAVSFHRLLLPDGTTYALDNFTGLNSIGDAGLKDQVNHHYWSTFGTAAAIGLVSGLAQYLSAGALAGGGGNGDRTVVITGSGADSTAQAVAQVLARYTNRLPTITIREGHRVRVYLTQDMQFPAYQDVRRALASGGS
jgi:type IV secretory pathway VirB10-like protein